MPVTIDIQLDSRQLSEIHTTLGAMARHAPTVISRSINRTLTSSRAAIVKSVRAGTALKAGKVRESMAMERATRSKLYGSISLSAQKINLIHYSARQVRDGVAFTTRRGTGRKKIRSGFIRAGTGGGVQVFRRAIARSGKGLVSRLPIVRQQGPSLAGLLTRPNDAPLTRIATESRHIFQKNLESQINLVLERGRP